MEILLILCVVALIISSIGFKEYIWFISIGYGLSIAGIGFATGIMFLDHLDTYTAILCLLLIIYGLRLGLYLLIRELKSKSYRKNISGDVKQNNQVSMIAKIGLWISVSILYVAQATPVVFRLMNHSHTDLLEQVGIVIMIIGILLESYSDYVKNKFKKTQPYRFCDVKVFRLVRCPNYLGEMLTWTGVLISGIQIYQNAFQWIIAVASYICIVYVMFSGARRLEIRQNKNYGNDPEYQDYVKRVPILLPFIPLYSVEKHKWLVG